MKLYRAARLLVVVATLTCAGCGVRQPPRQLHPVRIAQVPAPVLEQFLSRLRSDASATLTLEVPRRGGAKDSFLFTVTPRPTRSDVLPSAIFARGVGDNTGVIARIALFSATNGRLAFYDGDVLYVARVTAGLAIDAQPAKSWADASGRTCGVTGRDLRRPPGAAVALAAAPPPGVLKRYTIAIATTPKLRASYETVMIDIEEDILTAIHRANEILNRDLGIDLTVAGPSLAAGDVELESLADLNKAIVDLATKAGQQLDLGHLFDAGGGGRALIGSMCSATDKAGAYSRGPEVIEVGNFIHEVGHQLGAPHSFNQKDDGRHPDGAYEPGAGISMMSRGFGDYYYFHASSMHFVTAAVDGAAGCGEPFPESADVPIVKVPRETWHVPAGTPFELSASTDPSVQAYRWDEYDVGRVPNGKPPFFASSSDPGPSRIYPFLVDLLAGKRAPFWLLPQTLTFRVLGFSAGHNRRSTDVAVHVAGGFSRFEIRKVACTPPCKAGSALRVTWKPANTFRPPINVNTLRAEILESANGKPIRWHTIASAAAVDNQLGSAEIVLPADMPAMAEARLVLKANEGIFLALSKPFVIAQP